MEGVLIKNVFKVLFMLVLALILFQLMMGNTSRKLISGRLDNLYEGRVKVVSNNYGKDSGVLLENMFNEAKGIN